MGHTTKSFCFAAFVAVNRAQELTVEFIDNVRFTIPCNHLVVGLPTD